MFDYENKQNKIEPAINTDSLKSFTNNLTQYDDLKQSFNCTSYKDLFAVINIKSVFSELNPEEKGSYYVVTCPECGKNEAYIYKNNKIYIKCSRLNNCGAEISLWEYLKTRENLKSNKDVFRELLNISGQKINFIKKYDDNPIEIKSILKEIAFLKVNEDLIKEFNKYLLESPHLLKILEDKIGLNYETVRELNIGFSKNHDMWVFPTVDINDELFGAEFRTKYFTEFVDYENKFVKIKRPIGTDGRLCKINNPKSPKATIIIEGFKDGYTLYQYLKEYQLEYDYQILSPSCGVGSIPNLLLKNLLFIKDKKLIFSLDNDKAGKSILKSCIEKIDFPFYELKLPFSQMKFKDFNDWYLIPGNKEKNIFKEQKCIKINSLSVVNLYVHSDSIIGNNYKKSLSEKLFIEKNIIPFKNCYFEVYTSSKESKSYDTNKSYIHYKRITNFVLDYKHTIIEINNKENNEEIYKIEVIAINNKGEKSKPIVLSCDATIDVRELKKEIRKRGLFTNNLNDSQLQKILDEIYKKADSEVFTYSNPGLTKDNKFFIYENAVIDLQKNIVHEGNYNQESKLNTIKLEKNKEVRLQVENGMKATSLNLNNYSINELTEKYPYLNYTYKKFKDKSDKLSYDSKALITAGLILNTLEAYSYSIDALLIIGFGVISPFQKFFYDIIKGFPIGFLYGEAQSGKSNLLETNSYLYGFDKTFVGGGNDTVNNILHNLEYYNSLPIPYNEVGKKIKTGFEDFIKQIYDRNPRKIQKNYGQSQDIKNTNATIIFGSNETVYRNEQTLTRLLFCSIEKRNFIVKKAKEFNSIREKVLSSIIPDILEYFKKTEYLIDLFEESKKEIISINDEIDTRVINNISIAFTGIKLLFEKSGLNFNEFKEIKENYVNYLEKYKENVMENDFEVFVSIFIELVKQDKVVYNRDYKLNESNELAIYFEGVYNSFQKEFKQIYPAGYFAPTERGIKECARNDYRILKGEKTITKQVKISGYPLRCLVINISENDYLIDLIKQKKFNSTPKALW